MKSDEAAIDLRRTSENHAIITVSFFGSLKAWCTFRLVSSGILFQSSSYTKKKKIKKITQAREGRYPVRLAVAISEGDFHRI